MRLGHNSRSHVFILTSPYQVPSIYLIDFDKCLNLYNDRIQDLRLEKLKLEKEINELRTKRDNYDDMSPL